MNLKRVWAYKSQKQTFYCGNENIFYEKNYSFGFIDIDVIRNAYGRQKDSFEAPLEIMLDNKKYIFEGVFIRAPVISTFGKNVEVLSWLEREGEKQPVFVKQDNFIATSFHPELTDNPLIHKFFAKLCGF